MDMEPCAHSSLIKAVLRCSVSKAGTSAQRQRTYFLVAGLPSLTPLSRMYACVPPALSSEMVPWLWVAFRSLALEHRFEEVDSAPLMAFAL